MWLSELGVRKYSELLIDSPCRHGQNHAMVFTGEIAFHREPTAPQ